MGLWVFAYGSLMWKPGFLFDDKRVGFIRGYRRVFQLACIDHRGTPEYPARSCTLIEEEDALCWGIAYFVNGGPEQERLAIEYLERRECEYDTKSYIDFYTDEDHSKPVLTDILVFTTTPNKETNKYFLGPAPLEAMAKQIATAVGPCGTNCEYLFRLEKALDSIGHTDKEIIELANEVRRILGLDYIPHSL
eukprot:TRINITY_DN29009_c0_g1_i1.p1 TRINITY_DN29009_c0_g1~~TRINITY_DN29009_c0_g1_i1.p1  ORF type:complete len:192 (-),score=27.34 TRINITY_DN29009_c0_g1_i1:301-876(-)